MTPDEFAELLKTAEGRLIKETGASLLSLALKTQNLAVRNFTNDDLKPLSIRTRDTKRGKKGSPYRKWKKTGNSGYRVGPRRIDNYLSNSLNVKMSFGNPDSLLAYVHAGYGKAIKYAAALEYGAPSKGILPRLYIGRAVEDVQKDEANKELFKALKIAIIGRKGGN